MLGDDRYKAQGLVTQIQKVVNVKDSFTRMKLERERERQQHQAAYAATVQAKQKEAQERAALKDALYKLFTETNAWKRGKLLESALNNLFAFAGFLVREAFTIKGDEGQGIVEQIDGAVEIDGVLYIVEMKWWDKPIGRPGTCSPPGKRLRTRKRCRHLYFVFRFFSRGDC